MLSALSVAEFCRKEAAFLAASRRLRASCLCFSADAEEEDVDEESALFSRPSKGRPLPGFFDARGAAFSSSCSRSVDRGAEIETETRSGTLVRERVISGGSPRFGTDSADATLDKDAVQGKKQRVKYGTSFRFSKTTNGSVK